ncbi:hypothetical protein ACFL2Q_14855 [Thermodesulfobacteriota bacterium]
MKLSDFSSADEFELHVHKCFGKIFELLTKVDSVVKEEADKEEEKGNFGTMSDLRDWVEEAILYSHLAWQYHRLAKGPARANPWDEQEANPTDGDGRPT